MAGAYGLVTPASATRMHLEKASLRLALPWNGRELHRLHELSRMFAYLVMGPSHAVLSWTYSQLYIPHLSFPTSYVSTQVQNVRDRP